MCNKWFVQRTQVQVNLRWKSAVAVDVGVRSTSCSGFSWLVWRVASARCSSIHKVKAYLRHTLVVLVVILVEFHRYLVPAPLMCNQKVRKKVCLRAQSAPFLLRRQRWRRYPAARAHVADGVSLDDLKKAPRVEALLGTLRSGLAGATVVRGKDEGRPTQPHALCFQATPLRPMSFSNSR
jgi:hypothetical protein